MALPMTFIVNILLFITSILGPAIISLTGRCLGLPSMMKQQNRRGTCQPTGGENEGDSPQTHRVHCTNETDDNGELLQILDVAALWSVIKLYYSSTLSKLSNHPVFWIIVRLYFHSIMLSSYCGGVLWDWMQREFSLWIFYWLSYV